MLYDFDSIVLMPLDNFCEYVDNEIFTEENLSDTQCTFDQAISFDKLYDSMLNCKKGVMWKSSVVGYLENSIDNISKLETKLIDGSYKAKQPFKFTVWSPKKREIVAIHFEDRVVLRSLNDNIIYPIMTNPFVYSNCACLKKKGTLLGLDLLKKYMYRCYKEENNNQFYALLIDVKGYYPNMRHAYVEELFKKYLDPKTYEFVLITMHNQYEGDIGYNPGSQLILIAGISVPNKIDHWFKEVKHCKYYIRYMDDLIILHRDKEFLELLRAELELRFSDIGFNCNLKKTFIIKQALKIEFLGFKFFVNNSGEVVLLAAAKALKRDYRHWKRIADSIIDHKYLLLTEEKLVESIDSTIRYILKAKAFKLILRIEVKKEFLLKKVRGELEQWQILSI